MGTKLSIAQGVFQHGMAGFGAYSDYQDARSKGKGKLASVAKAGTEFAMGNLWVHGTYHIKCLKVLHLL